MDSGRGTVEEFVPVAEEDERVVGMRGRNYGDAHLGLVQKAVSGLAKVNEMIVARMLPLRSERRREGLSGRLATASSVD